jgi:hypothetical protein
MHVIAVANGKKGSLFFGYCPGFSRGGFCWRYGTSYNDSFTYADIFQACHKPSILKSLCKKGGKSCVINSVVSLLTTHNPDTAYWRNSL